MSGKRKLGWMDQNEMVNEMGRCVKEGSLRISITFLVGCCMKGQGNGSKCDEQQ
jgi:hypothetical protein